MPSLPSSLSIFAEPTVVSPRTGNNRNIITLKDKKANRPNDGTELEADAGCYYLDGDLCFSFLTSEGMAKVTVVSSALPNDLSKSVLSLYPFSMQIGYRPAITASL